MNKSYIFLLVFLLLIIACEDNPVENENDEDNNTPITLQKEIIDAGVRSVFTVAFGNNGLIAWGGLEFEIKVRGKFTLKDHIGAIYSIDFNENGNLLASGSSDHNIKIWDVATGKLLKTFSQHLTTARDVKFTIDGKSIISAENNHIVYWRNVVVGNTGKVLFLGHNNRINSIDIDRSNQTVISGSMDSTIKVWNANTGDELTSLNAHKGIVNGVEFSPVKNQFASCGSDSTIIIWDANSNKPTKSLKEHNGEPKTISYHPSGNYLASGNSDSKIYIYDLNNNTIIKILEGHTSVITTIDFNSDGNRIVSGAADDIVILWKNVFSD